jgi:dienelactone hydrolase
MSMQLQRGFPGLAATLLAVLVAPCGGQSKDAPSPLWGGLDPGPYGVGFRVIHAMDRSRTWDPNPDSSAREGFGRPVRISLWYPAPPKGVGSGMRYQEYVHVVSPGFSFARLDSLLEARNIESLTGIFAGTVRDYPRLLRLATAAHRDVHPAVGRFPLVVYSQGWNSGLQNDNTVLAEYLASHGYVVAAVPQVGELATDLTLHINPVDLEVQMRDVEFAMGVALDLPFVDRRKVALMGWSMGGVVGLWISGRNRAVDAVVGLDASFRARDFADMVLRSPYFDLRRLTAPMLTLQSGNPKYLSGQDDRLVDSLRLTDRYVGRVGNITHGDFSDFAEIARLFPVTILDRTAEQASAGHAAVCRSVLGFLDGVLKADAGALARLDGAAAAGGGLVTIAHRPTARVPSEEELVAALARDGLEPTLARLRALTQRYPGLEIVRLPALTRIGYAQLRQRRPDLAVLTFRLLTETYPSSADAFDSMADAYLALADSLGARRSYQRVLALVAADSSLQPAAREELRRRAEERLRALPVSP